MARADTIANLLNLLADGRFHSGEQLALRLGVSRTAIWKQVRGLQAETGLRVDSVRGRGYRLGAELELLDRARILGHLDSAVGDRLSGLQVLGTIESTNSRLMSLAAAGLPGGTVCLAERQMAGRGRRGRRWVSPFGSNIYLSLLWRFSSPPAALAGLSLACGVAVCRALEAEGARGLALKWPNDVLWNRRKLAGLLLEVAGEGTGPSHAVIGVGVNTRLDPQAARDIDQPWTDLVAVLGDDRVQRNRLAAAVIGELVQSVVAFAEEGLPPFLDAWDRYDGFRGERVVLATGVRQVEGEYAGIDAQGAIRLRIEGELVSFHSGEVSLCRRAD